MNRGHLVDREQPTHKWPELHATISESTDKCSIFCKLLVWHIGTCFSHLKHKFKTYLLAYYKDDAYKAQYGNILIIRGWNGPGSSLAQPKQLKTRSAVK